MHLLNATPGAITDGSEAIDLEQTPGDVVVITAADTEIACLAQAQRRLWEENPNSPSLRLASLLHLGHNMSVDLYVDDILSHAKFIVVRLLGGKGYWTYGVEELAALCRKKKIPLALLPGDDQPDRDLLEASTLSGETYHRLWQYFVQGGVDNAVQFLNYVAHIMGRDSDWREPVPLLRAGFYRFDPDKTGPVCALIFYRALVQAGNTKVIDEMMTALEEQGLNPMALFVQSLKDPVCAAQIVTSFETHPPQVILNTTGFALSNPNGQPVETPFDGADCAILQVVLSGSNKEAWADNLNGLSARDIAMNVALPEVDGRILSRAVSFKGAARRDELCQCDIVVYEPVADRLAFCARLAANWAALRQQDNKSKKVALILANYPNKDGRLANGVGLDTPAGALRVLQSLKEAGYHVWREPSSGNELVERLQAGITNDFRQHDQRICAEYLTLSDYQAFFKGLPLDVQTAITQRWGAPQEDPFFKEGAFQIAAYECGNVAICLQPARGYNIDPVETYHSPDLVPPHHYLAFYAWVRFDFKAAALIHMGKHGNLEWLPGKSIALSESCYPEAILGPEVHLYPFIINDPGEGTQAKRRAQAVIIDHLTPPLSRAETYGPLKDLEQLVDEYYEAAGVDPRRLKVLKKEILNLSRVSGLDVDCEIDLQDDEETALAKLDNHLCELKEMQIRDGLHIFGQSPSGRLLDDLLIALVRVPRASQKGRDQSLIRALANDLGLDFDPLDCEMAQVWTGPRPAVLGSSKGWRSVGDTLERLEELAQKLLSGAQKLEENWRQSAEVMSYVTDHLKPVLQACGDLELDGLLKGLAGRFVPAGPSGAPTRGRPDILPSGRNFYSVDTRTVPTPAAWTLGWKSASLLVERYLQDHGEWPRTMALSAWGTSNMRTGGDDIAQGLALMGVQPTWDSLSRRVTGFEIMPATVLGRPRVDVTLRVSGFFRDAFPGLIDLFDSAARAVAQLDEPAAQNPMAVRYKSERHVLKEQGLSDEEADLQAGFRVFGSKPGAYGAGLQALIDEKGWQDQSDFARAYIEWGGYAYGSGSGGRDAKGVFEKRLSGVEAIIHNQDNREHDLLDSDDYYQFEGGLGATVSHLKGTKTPIYHNDHSRLERPQIRTLEEEIARVVRARVVNPKWINGVKRHGYKGVFEMAATLDYMFAFAATTGAVQNHHFDLVFEAFILDEDTLAFIQENNPAALKEMLARFDEAIERGLWTPRSNTARFQIEEMTLSL